MTITLTREEAQQVLDALNDCRADSEELFYDYKQKYGEHYKPQRITFQQNVLDQAHKAIETLRARFASERSEATQPEPEPAAWDEVMQHYCYLLDNLGDLPIPDFRNWSHKQWEKGSALLDANDYFRTAPPQREWQGLTDEEIEDACWTEVDQRMRSFARAIEAKLKEKNT